MKRNSTARGQVRTAPDGCTRYLDPSSGPEPRRLLGIWAHADDERAVSREHASQAETIASALGQYGHRRWTRSEMVRPPTPADIDPFATA